MLESELQYGNKSSEYWTDSRVVLGYINNDVRRFHTFVAIRVQMIRENSGITTWRYVDSDCNPADDASRWIVLTFVRNIVGFKDANFYGGQRRDDGRCLQLVVF